MKSIPTLEKLNKLEGECQAFKNRLESLNTDLEESSILLSRIEKTQVIIQEVAQRTQQELKFHIEDIVSMALEAVFPDPYKFEINFVLKRGKTEVESWLVRRGKYTDPMSSNGGGVVDIVAFALRVTFWSFSKKSPVILLDEPFRFVSRDLQIRAGNVMKKLSESLGIQFIMVTHNQDMIDSATNVLQVRQKLGVSELTTRVNG